MKIALVLPFDPAYPGGVGNHVLQFAEYAQKAGHEVKIIAPLSRKDGYQTSISLISAGRAVAIPLPLSGTVTRVSLSVWNMPKIKKELTDGEYDVIHVHSPYDFFLGPAALRIAQSNGTPLVTTFHTNNRRSIFTFLYSRAAKITRLSHLMDEVDVRIAVSEAARDFILPYLPGEYRIIPNGVDVQRFSPEVRPIDEYLDGKTNILFVGRLGENETRKGLEELLLAFNDLYSNRGHQNTRLLIVGPGVMDATSRNIYHAINNKGAELIGRVSAEKLPRWFATSHIGAFPFRYGESFSLVVAETMASGKPVVTTDIPGPKSIVLNGSGVLIPPKNPKRLADALEELVVNPELREHMGRNGRQVVLENFSWDVVAPQILSAYAEIKKYHTQKSK